MNEGYRRPIRIPLYTLRLQAGRGWLRRNHAMTILDYLVFFKLSLCRVSKLADDASNTLCLLNPVSEE